MPSTTSTRLLGGRVPDRRPDRTAVMVGLAVAAIGALVLLDGTGAFDLSFALLAPVVCAALGAILLVSGMTRGR